MKETTGWAGDRVGGSSNRLGNLDGASNGNGAGDKRESDHLQEFCDKFTGGVKMVKWMSQRSSTFSGKNCPHGADFRWTWWLALTSERRRLQALASRWTR